MTEQKRDRNFGYLVGYYVVGPLFLAVGLLALVKVVFQF